MTGPNRPWRALGGGQEPRRMSRRRTLYPEQVSIRLRAGSLAAIERAAGFRGVSAVRVSPGSSQEGPRRGAQAPGADDVDIALAAAIRRDVADLRERMARIEGLIDGWRGSGLRPPEPVPVP